MLPGYRLVLSPTNILFVMPEPIPHKADVLSVNHNVEGIHQEFALAFDDAAQDPAYTAGFIASAHHVFGSLDHNHLPVGFHRGRALRGVRGLADVGIGDGHGASGRGCLADIREHHAHAAAALVGEALDIMDCARHKWLDRFQVWAACTADANTAARSPKSEEE